jgi:hypothetical protein
VTTIVSFFDGFSRIVAISLAWQSAYLITRRPFLTVAFTEGGPEIQVSHFDFHPIFVAVLIWVNLTRGS